MKCGFCGKETNKEYCSFECKKGYLDYFDEEDKFKSHRKPTMIASVVISIPLIVLFLGLGVTVMTSLLGITLIRYPFALDGMKKKMPPKKAKQTMQLMGVLLIIIGLPFLLLFRVIWM